MINFNLCRIISTCLLIVFVMGIFDEKVQNKGWFSNVMVVGVLSTLVALIPSLQNGKFFDWSLCYVLVGVLLLSTGLALGNSFLSERIDRMINFFSTVRTRFSQNFLNNSIWVFAKQVGLNGAKVIFIIGIALWAILTYPDRHPKRLALPQGTGERLAFDA